jgi:sorting nexin-25
MEYQDRRRRSLRVQFWLLVEGLKDPLEDIESDIDGSADLTLPTPDAVSTAMEDMTLIWDTYLSTNVLNSNHKYVKVVRAFIEGGTANVNTMDLHKVRRAVFAAQQDVLSEMEEEDFPGFSKSDLYYKAMADLPDTTSADTISPYASVSTLPPLSPRPPIIRSNPPTPPLRQLSTFASAVTPSAGSSHSPQLKRTDTAPPQLTFGAVFDQQRPVMRRQLSDATSPPSTPTFSTLALEHSNNSAKSATKVSNSLEFLMSSPDPGAAASFQRSPLFDEVSPGGRRSSATIEAATSHSDDDYVQVQTIEAIQEALNSILATDARGGNTPDTRSTIAGTPLSLSSSQELTSRSFSNFTEVRKPVHLEKGVKKRRAGKRVFDDDEDMSDLEPEDLEPEFDLNSIRFASPGDLQLPVEIAKLATTIEKLRNQEAVVGALIRKAELTGIASELKILFKSRESLRREMRALEFQKRQWESQESENKLVPGRTTVTISGTTVGQADGQSFQLYLVEVHQLALDGTYASGWIVTRRYSEFANLHLNLKVSTHPSTPFHVADALMQEKFYPARQLDFPGKRLVTSYNENFIEQRKSELEKYLQVRLSVASISSY